LIQNILRHAQATEAMIQVICQDNLVSLYAEDNGIGFDTNNQSQGLGYTQIRQLVALVNGTLRLQSAPGKGTQISVEFVPLASSQNGSEHALNLQI
jgi:signal transduction histidine kinase